MKGTEVPNWFKFYEDGLSEPRIQLCMSKQPLVLNVWLWILKECCRHSCGEIDWKPYSVSAASVELRVPEEVVDQCVKLLSEVEYIQVIDSKLIVRCWEKRQSEYNRKKRKNQREESTEEIRGEERCPTLSGQCPDTVRSASGHPSKKASMTDEEFLASLEAQECYKGIDVRREFQKMTMWCHTNRKEPTQRRFINWINRADKPMNGNGSDSPKPNITPYQLNEAMKRLEKESADFRNRHITEYAMGPEWDSAENREEYRRMKSKLAEWSQRYQDMIDQ